MNSASPVIGILVDYIGDQTKPIPPLAFVLSATDVDALNAGRTAMAVKHVPPRVYICTNDELEMLARMTSSVRMNAMRLTQAAPTFAVTIARRAAPKAAPEAVRFEVDPGGSVSMLEAMQTVVRNVEGRQGLKQFLRLAQ